MFCLNDTMRYFLSPGKTDMRKGMNSLCVVIHDKIGYDVRLVAVLYKKQGKRPKRVLPNYWKQRTPKEL